MEGRKMLTVTFRALREAKACTEGYRKLAKSKNGVTKWGLDTPIPLLDVLDSNGLDDTLWSLQVAEPKDETEKIARLFACDCAESVLPIFEKYYPDDRRPRTAIEVSRQFAYGLASLAE